MTGVMDQANTAIGDIKTKAEGTLDAITTTVNNTNGIVTGIRSGKGTVGMLLDDQRTATAVKNAVGNTQQAAANPNQVTVQAKQVMADFQSRDLFGKAEATLNNAKDASRQLAQISQRVNLTLAEHRSIHLRLFRRNRCRAGSHAMVPFHQSPRSSYLISS
jgi:phospholipid/cholesterol/gamma-HCH transport system substrate-binding protein